MQIQTEINCICRASTNTEHIRYSANTNTEQIQMKIESAKQVIVDADADARLEQTNIQLISSIVVNIADCMSFPYCY